MVPDEPGGGSKRVEGIVALLIGAENAHVHASRSYVRRHIDAGNTHEPYPGIPHFASDDVGKLLTEEFTNLLGPSTHPESPFEVDGQSAEWAL